MSRQQHCTTCVKPCTKDSCAAWFVRCPQPPPPCTTCVQRLYDVITYTNATEKEFNVNMMASFLGGAIGSGLTNSFDVITINK